MKKIFLLLSVALFISCSSKHSDYEANKKLAQKWVASFETGNIELWKEVFDEKSFEKQAQAERELKDRTRELLGYAQRITSPETTTLATHARNHGIEPSFDLPQSNYMAGDDRHEDNELQTLVLKKH